MFIKPILKYYTFSMLFWDVFQIIISPDILKCDYTDRINKNKSNKNYKINMDIINFFQNVYVKINIWSL